MAAAARRPTACGHGRVDVSDPVFERYKEALKQGHLALLRGKPKSALERYTEAAALADHRALPHLSVGSVLLRLGRPREALSAFDRAVVRAPEEVAGTTVARPHWPPSGAGRRRPRRPLGWRPSMRSSSADVPMP